MLVGRKPLGRYGLGYVGLLSGPPSWLPGNALAGWDFANDRYWNASYTYTRSGTAYAENLAGVYSSFGANAIRRTDKGVLIEPAATRINRYPRDLTNAGFWSKGAGASASLDAVGIDGASSAAATVTISVADATAFVSQDTTVVAETAYMYSFFPKAGTATGLRYALRDNTNAAFIVIDVAYSGGAGVFSRIEIPFTTPAGCVSLRLMPLRNPAGTGTFITDGHQLELGTVATSPMLGTPTTAGSRSADALGLVLPVGTHDLTFTFDDDTTQTVTGQSGTYNVPTSLNRPWIKRVHAVAA